MTRFDPFRMKKIYALPQEDDLVLLFGEMTKISTLSESKPPLAGGKLMVSKFSIFD